MAIGGWTKICPRVVLDIRMNCPASLFMAAILPGEQRRDIVSVFEAVGGHAAGTVSDIELQEWKPPRSLAQVPVVVCTPRILWPRLWRR